MAINRFKTDGYGQLELNNVAFRRDGRIEAQCKLNSSFSEAKPAENGMILAVDNVKREVGLPTGTSKLLALNYSSEHLYDERAQGLKNFKLAPGEFLPRLGYLAVGDKFTTNLFSYDTTADETLLKNDEGVKTNTTAQKLATKPLYGKAHTDGTIIIGATDPKTGLVLMVTKQTTMPDGQFALQFQVVNV